MTGPNSENLATTDDLEAAIQRKKRKERSQTKINMYFPKRQKGEPVSKLTATKLDVKVNKQGYKLSRCVFEPDVNQHMYYPLDFLKDVRQMKKERPDLVEGKSECFCPKCNLQPCALFVKELELLSYTEHHKYFKNHDNRAAYWRGVDYVFSYMCDLFGLEYAVDNYHLPCVHKLLMKRYPHDMNEDITDSELEVTDSELEEVFT